jgi:hydrogenase expression/formation protein HypC
MCLAVPGRILSITGDGVIRAGRVDFGGLTKEVNLAYVPEAAPGDYVLVHVGFAIGTIDAAEAGRIIAELERLDDLVAGAVPGRSRA